MGVGAMFISTLALSELKVPQNPPQDQEEYLAATLQIIVSFIVLCSIFIREFNPSFHLRDCTNADDALVQHDRWHVHSNLLCCLSDQLSDALVDEDLDFRSGQVGPMATGLVKQDQAIRVEISLANYNQAR
jgi:hypothetical protein